MLRISSCHIARLSMMRGCALGQTNEQNTEVYVSHRRTYTRPNCLSKKKIIIIAHSFCLSYLLHTHIFFFISFTSLFLFVVSFNVDITVREYKIINSISYLRVIIMQVRSRHYKSMNRLNFN